jgi:hypothetical protein
MRSTEEAIMSGTPGAQDPNQFNEADFQAVLKALLAAYQPELEADLRRAQAPDDLTKEARGKPPSCEDEIALAEAIFGKFLTEEIALRMLPRAGREQLGPPAQWRWCLVHLRCCLIFGWLVCRGPRTFRAFSYYVYRYWLCVRAAIGTPVHTPPTEEEQADFRTLVDVLAVAFKPYLTDQLASVAYPTGIPEEVFDGRIDCLEGLEDTDAVFERLLSPDAAEALLGRAAFAEHHGQAAFWYCRCWCLCLIRFGCCLARARNLVDLFRCLEFLFRCLNDCFQPIRCDITAPSGCAEELPGLPGTAGRRGRAGDHRHRHRRVLRPLHAGMATGPGSGLHRRHRLEQRCNGARLLSGRRCHRHRAGGQWCLGLARHDLPADRLV